MAHVSRKYLIKLLRDERGHEFVQHVVGRACVALFNRQTVTEQDANITNVNNYEGFSSSDARQGSLTAKYYLKHGKLEEWQVEQWLQTWRGRPRLAKYWRQLNKVAEAKEAA